MRPHAVFGAAAVELRTAARRIARGRSASIVSILALACGVGAAAATWSLMNALLLNPLPVASPDSLFVVGMRQLRNGQELQLDSYSYPLYQRLRESGAFERAVGGGTVRVSGSEGDTIEVYFASHDLFETLGVPMALGRSFAAADDVRGARPTIVLSHSYWQQRMGGDPGVLGTTIPVGEGEGVIVGVAGEGFRGISLARSPQMFMPLHTVRQINTRGLSNYFAEPIPPATSSPIAWLQLIGRVAPGRAAAARDRFKNLVLDNSPAMNEADFEVELIPINEAAVPAAARDGMRQFVLLLAGTVGFLMLAGCLSAGMLLLVRTESRRDELATARALGASSSRIAMGIAIEGALLATAGALAAVPFAFGLFRSIGAFDLPGRVPVGLLDLSIDGASIAAVAIGGAIAMATVSIIAVVFASSVARTGVLGARAHATPDPSRFGARAWLVVAQVAVALVLMAGTGLFARSLIAALSLNPGYDTDRIVTGAVPFPAERVAPLFDELLQRLDTNPTIESAAALQEMGGMTTFGQLEIDGIAQQFPSIVWYRGIDAQYFATMGLAIVDGRAFSADDREGAEPVAIVSESLARLIEGADGRTIGRSIATGIAGTAVQIVGVVPDIVLSVDALEPLVMYTPAAQSTRPGQRSLVFRAASDPETAMRAVVATIREIAPDVVPGPMQTIDMQLLSQLREQRFGVTLMGVLGAIAVLLTAMAIYVLAESMGARRRREFGIRAALGARGATLAGSIVLETTRLVGIGTAVGLGIAWAGTRVIRTFLFQVRPFDAVTMTSVALLMLLLALLVSLRPALSAMRVDLSRLLRDE